MQMPFRLDALRSRTGLGRSSAWQLPWSTVARTLPALLGVGFGLWGMWRATLGTLAFAYRNISVYDEGVLLTGAHELLWGNIPYRDFYTNYPPGIFLLIALGFKVFGSSVAVERALGLILHLAVAAASGKLAGRLLRARFSWVTAALVLTWIAPVGIIAYTWFAALALALLACDLWGWARVREQPWRYGLTGAVLGISSWFRHDLFIYFSLALSAAGALWISRALLVKDRGPLRIALWAGAGALLTVGAMWLPVFALAGFGQVAADLYFDQVRHIMPARVLPLPPLFELKVVSWFPLALPAFLREPFASAVFLTFAGPGLASLALLWPRGAGITRSSEYVWPAALSFAVLPQMLGRTDFWHAIFTAAPALIWSWVWFHGGGRRRLPLWGAWPLALCGAALLYVPRQFDLPKRLWPPPYKPAALASQPPHLARAGLTRVDGTRQKILAFVEKHTQAGEPIYVGLSDHRWTFWNDMDLYYLTNRVGATRYRQFDPNVVNRKDVQEQMIEELERVRPKVAILSTAPQNKSEPNESRNEGSAVLDHYLRARYAEQGRAGHFLLTLRKPDDAEVSR